MSLQSRLADLITAIGADMKKHHGVVTVAATATLTPTSAAKQYNITGQNAALTIAAPTGTFTDGQDLLIRIKDNGTARAISWNAVFRAVGITLPTTTVVSKVLYVGAKWNAAENVFDVIAVGQQA
jgi:hypothetical protein